MKFSIFGLFVLASFAYGRNVHLKQELSPTYGYIKNYGIPEAERIRKAEENYLNTRIVGGVPAAPGQYPYQAGLVGDIAGLSGSSVCGGSLVSNNRVITAAHCWFDGVHQIWRFTVVLGSTLLFSGGTRIETSAVVTHPNYTPTLARNDLAILFLPTSVTISNTIAPISLPSGSVLFENFSGDAAIAIGFGLTADDGTISSSQALNHVRVTVIGNTLCSLAFPIVVQSSNICTSGIGGVGICSGDSGGPLIVSRDNQDFLIGVSSFGSALGCQSGIPSVYARVTSFMDFFNSHI